MEGQPSRPAFNRPSAWSCGGPDSLVSVGNPCTKTNNLTWSAKGWGCAFEQASLTGRPKMEGLFWTMGRGYLASRADVVTIRRSGRFSATTISVPRGTLPSDPCRRDKSPEIEIHARGRVLFSNIRTCNPVTGPERRMVKLRPSGQYRIRPERLGSSTALLFLHVGHGQLSGPRNVPRGLCTLLSGSCCNPTTSSSCLRRAASCNIEYVPTAWDGFNPLHRAMPTMLISKLFEHTRRGVFLDYCKFIPAASSRWRRLLISNTPRRFGSCSLSVDPHPTTRLSDPDFSHDPHRSTTTPAWSFDFHPPSLRRMVPITWDSIDCFGTFVDLPFVFLTNARGFAPE
jgi:hypothetical protein